MEALEKNPLFKDMCSYLLAASAKVTEFTFGECLLMPGKCVALPTKSFDGHKAKTKGGAIWEGGIAASEKSAEVAQKSGFPKSVCATIFQSYGMMRMHSYVSFLEMFGKKPPFDLLGDFNVEFPKYQKIEAEMSHDRRKEFEEYVETLNWRPWFLLKFGFCLTLQDKLRFFAETIFDFSNPNLPLTESFDSNLHMPLYEKMIEPGDYATFKHGFNAMILGTFPKVNWKSS